jgi:hypothetical protein
MDQLGSLFPVIIGLIGIIAAIKKAADKNAKKNAVPAPIDQALAQVNARAASAVAVAPRQVPIMPPVIPPSAPARARPVTTAGFGAAQPTPSAEGLLVSGLFTQPRSLVAAFVASEILGPPVAFRHH